MGNFERFLYVFFFAHAAKYMKAVYDLTKRKHSCVENGPHLKPSDARRAGGSFFANKDGLWIHHRKWVPSSAQAPKGVIFLAHGLGEHLGRYNGFAEMLCKENYAVYAIDHQGHGQSEGDRCHLPNGVEDFMADMFQYITIVRTEYLEGRTLLGQNSALPPFFLLGHSMGGNVAVRVASETEAELGFRWDGVVLSAPAIKADPAAAGPVIVKLAKFINSIFPKLGLDGLDSNMVCRNKAVVQRYRNDPLVYQGLIRASMGVGLLNSFDVIENKCLPTFDLPFLMCVGSMDRLVLVSACLDFHENAPSKDKELKVYNDFYHEILQEDGGDEVERDILAFLNARA